MKKAFYKPALLIREDAHILYGFFDKAEKEMFLNLISVSGIGATTARMMLSYMKPEELTRSIVLNDIHGLEKIKGIGKKTAERLVLELKDKLAKQPFDLNISPLKHNTLHSRCVKCPDGSGNSPEYRRSGNPKGHTIRPFINLP